VPPKKSSGADSFAFGGLIRYLRHVTRNVKRRRAGDMIRRWSGLGLLRAARTDDGK